MLRLEVSKHSFKSSGRNLLSLIVIFIYFDMYFLRVLSGFCAVILFQKYLYAKNKKITTLKPYFSSSHSEIGLFQNKMYFRRFPYGVCALMRRKCDCAFSTPLPCFRGAYNVLQWSSLKHFSILLHKTVWHAMNYIFTVRQTCLSVQSRDMMMCFFAS